MRLFHITPEMQISQPTELETARAEVLAWLRRRDPLFLKSVAVIGHEAHAEIVERFLSWLEPAGFVFEIVNDGSKTEPALVGHWRFRGDHLIGFKQPPPAQTTQDAGILACAALLRNEWCQSRLA